MNVNMFCSEFSKSNFDPFDTQNVVVEYDITLDIPIGQEEKHLHPIFLEPTS